MASRLAKQRYLERRIAAQGRIETIVSNWLLPRLDWPTSFALTPVADGHNLVYYLDAPDREPLVVRAGERRSKFRRRIRLHRYLGRRRIPVPTVRAHNLGLLDRRQDGLFISAEDRLAGTPIVHAEDPLAAARLSGRLFAALHEIRPLPSRLIPRSHWTRGRNEQSIRGQAKHGLRRYEKLDPETADRAGSWLEGWPADSWRHGSRLCLGDVGKKNVIGDENGVGLVDLVGLTSGSVAVEMGRVRHMLLSGKEAEWRAFLAAYVQGSSAALRDEFNRLRRFGEAIYLLEHNVRRKRKKPDPVPHRRLLDILDTSPGPDPSDMDGA